MTSKPPDIARLAYSYRRLVLWFGVQLLLTFFSVAFSAPYRGVDPPMSVTVASAFVSFCILGTAVMLAIYSYRTAGALGSSVPVLWVVAMVIPFINVISLLVLSARSTAACRASGVPVGFLGPKFSAPSAPPVPPVGPK